MFRNAIRMTETLDERGVGHHSDGLHKH
jgi:hypothetical protein